MNNECRLLLLHSNVYFISGRKKKKVIMMNFARAENNTFHITQKKCSTF